MAAMRRRRQEHSLAESSFPTHTRVRIQPKVFNGISPIVSVHESGTDALSGVLQESGLITFVAIYL